jgi:hypothetical protein
LALLLDDIDLILTVARDFLTVVPMRAAYLPRAPVRGRIHVLEHRTIEGLACARPTSQRLVQSSSDVLFFSKLSMVGVR